MDHSQHPCQNDTICLWGNSLGLYRRPMPRVLGECAFSYVRGTHVWVAWRPCWHQYRNNFLDGRGRARPLAGFCRDPLNRGACGIRKEAWPFYRTSSGVRLCWELEEPKGPKGMGRMAAVLASIKERLHKRGRLRLWRERTSYLQGLLEFQDTHTAPRKVLCS